MTLEAPTRTTRSLHFFKGSESLKLPSRHFKGSESLDRDDARARPVTLRTSAPREVRQAGIPLITQMRPRLNRSEGRRWRLYRREKGWRRHWRDQGWSRFDDHDLESFHVPQKVFDHAARVVIGNFESIDLHRFLFYAEVRREAAGALRQEITDAFAATDEIHKLFDSIDIAPFQ